MAILPITQRKLSRAIGSPASGAEICDAIDLATTVITASVATPAGNTTHAIKFTDSSGTEMYVPAYLANTF